MERDAHYAAVGIATVALMAALAVFAIWLARLSFANEYDLYDVVFHEPVRGLQEGGEVHFNGIRVGEVTDLKLDPGQADRVIARIRIDGGTPVRVTSRAQLEPLGITGLNYIQITAGDPNSDLLSNGRSDSAVPTIQSQPSPLSELLSGSGTVMAQAVDALNRINRVLSDENIRAFSASLRNVEGLTAEFAARKSMLDNLETALESANRAILEWERLGASARQLVETDGRQAIASINNAAGEASAAIASINRTATALERPAGELADTGLPQLNEAISELNAATAALRALIEDARASPREVIGRPPSRELEVQP